MLHEYDLFGTIFLSPRMFVNSSTMNDFMERMAHEDIVKIRLFFHILALRVEEEVVWSRENLRKDRQSVQDIFLGFSF